MNDSTHNGYTIALRHTLRLIYIETKQDRQNGNKIKKKKKKNTMVQVVAVRRAMKRWDYYVIILILSSSLVQSTMDFAHIFSDTYTYTHKFKYSILSSA